MIGPEQRTITEIDYNGNDRKLRKIHGCDSFTAAAMLNGSISEGFDTLYVSD